MLAVAALAILLFAGDTSPAVGVASGRVECRDASSLYILESPPGNAAVIGVDCSDGYVSITLQVSGGDCPAGATALRGGVEVPLPLTAAPESGGCRVTVSTRGLSLLRLGCNESLAINFDSTLRVSIYRYRLSGTPSAASTTPGGDGEAGIYTPTPVGGREPGVHSDLMPGGAPRILEALVGIALLALTAAAAVKEYGGAGGGG